MDKEEIKIGLLKEVTSEFGRRGGRKTLERHGREHYLQMNRKRWRKQKARAVDNQT